MKLRTYDILFLAIVTLLCSWHLDSSLNDNTVSRAAMVAAVAEHGTFSIDRYHELTDDKAKAGGHFYSEKAPLPSLLMIPIWWLAVQTGLFAESDSEMISSDLLQLAGFICGSLPLVIIIFWTWRRLRVPHVPITASWMAILPFLGSFLFLYSGSFFGHLIAGLFLLLAWDRRRADHHFQAGILSSAAVLSEFSLFVFPLIWCLQDLITRRWRSLRSLILGGLPALMILIVMNMIVTGSPFQLPYSNVQAHADQERIFGLGAPSIDALSGLFFSAHRGMFVYAPVTLLCAMVIVQRMFSMNWRSVLLHPLIVPSILLVLLISSHSMWWGGWALGPRHLTSLVILVFAAGLPLVRSTFLNMWAMLLLSLIGLWLNFAAKSTVWFSAPTDVPDPIFHLILPAFIDRSFTQMQWPVDLGMGTTEATFLFFITFVVALAILRKIDASIEKLKV